MSKIIKNTLILTAITLIAGLALATVYQITKEPIARAEAAAELEAYEGVFPGATFEKTEVLPFDAVAAEVADGEGVTVEESRSPAWRTRWSATPSRSPPRTATAGTSPWRSV